MLHVDDKQASFVAVPYAAFDDLLEEVRAIRETLANSGPASPWLSVESAARYLDSTEDSIRSLVKRGQLRAHRPNGARLVFLHRDDLDAFARGDVS